MRHKDALGHHSESLVEVKVDDITAFPSSTTVLVFPSQQTMWLTSTLGKSMLANPNYCFHLHMPRNGFQADLLHHFSGTKGQLTSRQFPKSTFLPFLKTAATCLSPVIEAHP